MNVWDWIWVLLLSRSITNIIATLSFIINKHIQRCKTGIESIYHHNLYVILPVYKEVSAVESAVKQLAVLVDGQSKVQVIIVGSSAERKSEAGNETVKRAEYAAKRLKFSRITILEAPQEEGQKAGQLNHACSCIPEDPRHVWIYVLDVDSRITSKALSELRDMIEKGHEVIQQHAVFLANIKDLGLLQLGHALYQSRWTFAYEVKRIWLHRVFGISNAHLTGHGLAIRFELLQRYGMFPSGPGLEDLNIGFYFAAAGVRITSAQEIEIGDSPSTAKDGFWQQYRWAYGILSVWAYRRAFCNQFAQHSKILKTRAWIVTLIHLSGIASWNFSTYLIILALWQALHGEAFALSFLSSYVAEFTICIFWFRRMKLIPYRCMLLAPLAVLADAFRRSFPANLASFDFLFDIHREATKTRPP